MYLRVQKDKVRGGAKTAPFVLAVEVYQELDGTVSGKD